MDELYNNQKPGAHCQSCKYFGVDCNPDAEDFDKPCDAFEPREEN